MNAFEFHEYALFTMALDKWSLSCPKPPPFLTATEVALLAPHYKPPLIKPTTRPPINLFGKSMDIRPGSVWACVDTIDSELVGE